MDGIIRIGREKIRRWLTAGLIILMSSGCVFIPTDVSVTSSTKVIPSPIMVTEPPTSQPVLAGTNTQPSIYCWPIMSLPQGNVGMRGSLLYRESGTTDNRLFSLASQKISPGRTKELDSDFVHISPDGSILATLDVGANLLHLNFQGSFRSYPIPEYAVFGGFINNEKIWFRKSRAVIDNYRYSKGTTDELYILTLQDGSIETRSEDLPGFWTNEPATTRVESYVVYSPNLRYVFYSANGLQLQNALINLGNGEVIWSGGDLLGFPLLPLPEWLPDSSGVVIAQYDSSGDASPNLYLVETDGGYSKIAAISGMVKQPYGIQYVTASPNSHSIAFVVNRASVLTLFLLDLNSNTLTETCLSNDPLADMQELNLIWSYDGSYLALTFGGKAHLEWTDPQTAKYVQDVYPDILIMDLVRHEIYKPPIQVSALLGWLSWELP